MDHPKIREGVNAFPLTIEGKPMICFQDSQSLSEGLLISPELFARVVSFFDGQHSIRDIQYEAMRKYGELIYTEQIEAVVQQMDTALLLESQRSSEALVGLREEFRKGSRRAAFLSGKSYPSNAAELKEQVESYFLSPEGPGMPDRNKKGRALKGVIAPHIDFQRGGHCYAYAYKAVAEAREADLYIILGIAHTPSNSRFSLTSKDFETPLGVAKTDKCFIEALSGGCSGNLFEDEFLHRSEHSIEFQVVFLQSVLGPAMRARIVPILCGSFDHYFVEQRLPEEDPAVSQFLESMRLALANSEKRVCFIAGIDLSHVGPQFGDRRSADGFVRSEIQEADLKVLENVANCDAEALFTLVAKDRNRRRICGFPAIYMLLRSMEARQGEILKYDQGPTPDRQSVVSFAAMVFHG